MEIISKTNPCPQAETIILWRKLPIAQMKWESVFHALPPLVMAWMDSVLQETEIFNLCWELMLNLPSIASR